MLAAGQEPIDGALLRHVADQLPDLRGLLHDVQPEHARVTARRPQHGDENTKRGGFARAVRAEQPEHLSGTDLKADVLGGGRPAGIDFRQTGGFDGGRDGRAAHCYPHPI